MTQITQMSGIPEPNLRNLWNLWISTPVPLHSASCFRGPQFRNRVHVGRSSRVFPTGPPEAAEGREPRSQY
jgi:hypothetical protein